MTNKDDNTALIALAVLWVMQKFDWAGLQYTQKVAPAIQQGGAKLYETLHDDEGHNRDLPGHQLTRAAVLAIATKAGFPNPKLAAAIALAESGGVPGAIQRSSRENSIGLWQINLKRWTAYNEADMKDPMKNAAAALRISKGGTDWHDWSTYTKGKYKQFQTGILKP